MQVLWSRTAQAKLSCRCYSCVHSVTTALARRSTTAATKRRVTVGDVFTASFSTILGTATFVDARTKADRRKEWDVAISNIKAELPDNDSNPHTQLNLQAESSVAHTWIRDSQRAISDNGVTRGGSGALSWASSQFDSNDPTAQFIPMAVASDGLECPESDIYGSNGVSNGVRSQPIGPKKGVPRWPRRRDHLQQMEDATRKLATELLLLTDIPSIEGATIVSSNKELVELASLLQELRTAFIPFPAFYRHHTSQRLGELHRVLKQVFEKESSSPDINMLVGKICYNLLVSPTPPSTGTYNYLMRKFSLLQQDRLTQVVANSFFNDTVLKANEDTAKILLEYYIEKGDLAGFRAIVKRMRGVDGDMHIKRKNVYELSRNKDVRNWALQNKVIHRGAHLYEKMDRSPAIFELLIRGAMQWDGTKGAVRFVRAALREGKVIYSQTMIHVIEACVTACDYRSGLKLLNTILSCWADGTLSSIMDYGPATRQKLHQLFALCGVDPSSSSPQPILPISSQELLPSILRWMELESISDRLAEFANHTLTIRLALEGPQHPLVPRLNDQKQTGRYTDQHIQSCIEVLRGASSTEETVAYMDQKNTAECRSIREAVIKVRMVDKKSNTPLVYGPVSSEPTRNPGITGTRPKLAVRRIIGKDSEKNSRQIQWSLAPPETEHSQLQTEPQPSQHAIESSVSSTSDCSQNTVKAESKASARRVIDKEDAWQSQWAFFQPKPLNSPLRTELQPS